MNLSSKPSYIPENPASAHVPASSSTQWSAEPERFVEKSQLELRAEKEAAQRANQAKQKGPTKSDFPTLGRVEHFSRKTRFLDNFQNIESFNIKYRLDL